MAGRQHGPSRRLSNPGDLIELQAGMDVLALVSNCPQTRNPVNNFNPTPIRIILWQP